MKPVNIEKSNKWQKKLKKVNTQIDQMATTYPFEDCEETYIKNIDFAMEFALENKEINDALSNSDIRFMYNDIQELKKLTRLVGKKARILRKINSEELKMSNLF